MSSAPRRKSPPKIFAKASGSSSPKATAGVRSDSLIRRSKARPLSPAEKEREKEAAKQAYLERRKVVEETGVLLQKEYDELAMEISQLQAASGEGGMEGRLVRMKKECERLEMEVIAATSRVDAAERHVREASGRLSQNQKSQHADLRAVSEEIDAFRRSCAEHEDKAQWLFARVADTRELLERGADELQQLRNELWERQGEKAQLVADQASAARIGAEQRAQAIATEAHVTHLAKALDCEDMRLAREQRRLRRAEDDQGERVEEEKRQWEQAAMTLPESIREERDEVQRCEKVAEERQEELRSGQEALAKVQARNMQLAEQVRSKTSEVWRSEGARDAARVARQALEAETARVEADIQQIKVRLDKSAEQNRELMLTHMKAKNFCSVLEQAKIRQEVDEFMKKYPDDTRSPNLSDLSRQIDTRAARLQLAGIRMVKSDAEHNLVSVPTTHGY